jgi:hypothetical protein
MKQAGTSLSALVSVLIALSAPPALGSQESATEESEAMQRVEEEYGKPNPSAPSELSRFAFLIGKWQFDAKLKRKDRTNESFSGTWEGHYVLDGYAIADEYRMTTSAGDLVVLGMNLRAYDSKKKAWNMKWLNALTGTWVDLGPEELGGVAINDKSISYSMKEPVAEHAFTRATYTIVSENHFTWRGEGSNDLKTWEEFLVIDVYRSQK